MIFSSDTNLTRGRRGKNLGFEIWKEIRVCGEIEDKLIYSLRNWGKDKRLIRTSHPVDHSPTPCITHGDLDSGFTPMRITLPRHASHAKIQRNSQFF